MTMFPLAEQNITRTKGGVTLVGVQVGSFGLALLAVWQLKKKEFPGVPGWLGRLSCQLWLRS